MCTTTRGQDRARRQAICIAVRRNGIWQTTCCSKVEYLGCRRLGLGEEETITKVLSRISLQPSTCLNGNTLDVFSTYLGLPDQFNYARPPLPQNEWFLRPQNPLQSTARCDMHPQHDETHATSPNALPSLPTAESPLQGVSTFWKLETYASHSLPPPAKQEMQQNKLNMDRGCPVNPSGCSNPS